MARYKDVESRMKMLPVDLSRQLLPGTFEHALSHLIDHELDLSHFDAHYHNDARGSTAYPPAMLLKVVLFACSQGIVSSRAIERACRDPILRPQNFADQCGQRSACVEIDIFCNLNVRAEQTVRQRLK